MKSYIKIYGPPVLKAIKALEKVAVDMPEVCIMDSLISVGIPRILASDVSSAPVRDMSSVDRSFEVWTRRYLNSSGIPISGERCKNIISRSGGKLGEYDFFFEWFKEPDSNMLNTLIEKIDQALKPLGCYYKITTK